MTRDDLWRTVSNPALIVGVAGMLLLAAIALFGPQLATADPNAQRIVIFFPDGHFLVPPTPPDQYYPLGTDPLGRDQLARILYGARLTFTVVLFALLLRASLAVVVGVIGGWRGGAVDRALLVVTNAVSGVPQLLLALLIAVALRDRAIVGFIVALGLVGWAEGAQFVRSEVVRIRSRPYIEAARALGDRTSSLLSRHVLRGLAPQLFGLLSLEAGSTLLLLAELGFLGVFMSGGTFLVDAQNRPILPARDRAPEWGQMLAGAQQYAFHDQYVAFVPGVVVGLAVFVFNLLGEGVRTATDPFSTLSLSPRALGALGRGTLAVALVSATFFGMTEARTTTLSFDDALRLARESVAKVEPGAPLVAAVVSLRSDAHALESPAKYNFYFRSKGPTAYIRVGFPNADQNAMETKRDEEDGIALDELPALQVAPEISWQDALAIIEKQAGAQYRASTRTWLVRVVLARDASSGRHYYRVMYSSGSIVGVPNAEAFLDAETGMPPTGQLRDSIVRTRAQETLGGPVVLAAITAYWRNAGSGGFGMDRPVDENYGFVRADLKNDVRAAYVSTSSTAPVALSASTVRRVPLTHAVDLDAAFRAVDAQGGAALREQWTTDGYQWQIQGNATQEGSSTLVLFTYQRNFVPLATFRYDPVSGAVTRTQ